MPKKKSWREKLADDKDLPKVVSITGRMQARWGRGTVVIPAPREVDAIMKRVPPGKVITINEIRALLAASMVPPSDVQSPQASSPGSLPMPPRKLPPRVRKTPLLTGAHSNPEVSSIPSIQAASTCSRTCWNLKATR